MHPEQLHLAVAYNNPMRWRSRLVNYMKVEAHLLAAGVKLTTAELGYGDRDFELPDHPEITRLRLRTRDVLWHKENLLRVAFQHAPPEARYLGYIDGDTWMTDPTWAREAVHQLQIHPVVQLSSDLVFLGPRGEHVSKGTSLAYLHHKHGWFRDPNPCLSGPWGYPGLGWAFRREAYDALGGLLDICILGSGDYHMARGLLGLPEAGGAPWGVNIAYNRHIDRWRERAAEVVKGDVGVVMGTAMHLWHGSYKSRGYESRPSILVRHQFDPDTDIVRDAQGLLKLAGNKPKLRDELRAYFASRDEDSVDLA